MNNALRMQYCYNLKQNLKENSKLPERVASYKDYLTLFNFNNIK